MAAGFAAGANVSLTVLLSTFLSGSFTAGSAVRPRPLGVVGVLGNGDLIGEAFAGLEDGAMDIGAGRVVVLLVVAFSTGFVAAGFLLPLV